MFFSIVGFLVPLSSALRLSHKSAQGDSEGRWCHKGNKIQYKSYGRKVYAEVLQDFVTGGSTCKIQRTTYTNPSTISVRTSLTFKTVCQRLSEPGIVSIASLDASYESCNLLLVTKSDQFPFSVKLTFYPYGALNEYATKELVTASKTCSPLDPVAIPCCLKCAASEGCHSLGVKLKFLSSGSTCNVRYRGMELSLTDADIKSVESMNEKAKSAFCYMLVPLRVVLSSTNGVDDVAYMMSHHERDICKFRIYDRYEGAIVSYEGTYDDLDYQDADLSVISMKKTWAKMRPRYEHIDHSVIAIDWCKTGNIITYYRNGNYITGTVNSDQPVTIEDFPRLDNMFCNVKRSGKLGRISILQPVTVKRQQAQSVEVAK